MPKIFISYRKQDSEAEVTHLYEDLKRRYGTSKVFLDSRTLVPGKEWLKQIESHLAETDVVLIVMGKEWSQLGRSGASCRLLNPEDIYRLEIAAALRRHPGVDVIPVLLDGVTVPD